MGAPLPRMAKPSPMGRIKTVKTFIDTSALSFLCSNSSANLQAAVVQAAAWASSLLAQAKRAYHKRGAAVKGVRRRVLKFVTREYWE